MFQEEIINILIIVATAGVGIMTKSVLGFMKKKGILTKLEINKELIKIAVEAIEQTYKTLHGEEKFAMAKMEAIRAMNEKGIKISEKEIDLLIQASVKEMNDAAKSVSENKEQ